MSQTYVSDAYEQGYGADTVFQRYENNDEALRSTFSGSTYPANIVAGQLHTRTGTYAGLRVRNAGNTAWLKVLTGAATFKIWQYGNTAEEGWRIDTTVTDCVLSLKGGTGLYNANGGTTVGTSWANLKAHTHVPGTLAYSHIHKWYEYTYSSDGKSYNSAGTATSLATLLQGASVDVGDFYLRIKALETVFDNSDEVPNDMYTAVPSSGSFSGSTGAQSTADPRPTAANGILVYPEMRD